MNDLSEIRRANLNAVCIKRNWISRKNPNQGSPSDLATRLGRSSSFWSDRLNGTKSIGAELSRQIEEQLDLPKYSLDGDEEQSDFVSVARLSVEVGAGAGRHADVIEELGVLQFRRDFLRTCGVSPINAAIVTVVGTSMEPTIHDSAVLLLNRADKEPRSGCIYAFSLGNEILVKRFQKINSTWFAISDNGDKYEHPDIEIDGSVDAHIHGRAIWMGAKL